MSIQRVNVPDVGRLPAFSHASIVDRQVFVAGMLGTVSDQLEVVPGGVGAETRQILENLARVLGTCGSGFGDVAMVHVYLTDMNQFSAMNEVYTDVFGEEDPPARITVGCTALALGAGVEIDCIAFVPDH